VKRAQRGGLGRAAGLAFLFRISTMPVIMKTFIGVLAFVVAAGMTGFAAETGKKGKLHHVVAIKFKEGNREERAHLQSILEYVDRTSKAFDNYYLSKIQMR